MPVRYVWCINQISGVRTGLLLLFWKHIDGKKHRLKRVASPWFLEHIVRPRLGQHCGGGDGDYTRSSKMLSIH